MTTDYCQLADLAGLAQCWLSDDPNCLADYDLQPDAVINLKDFALLQVYWQIRADLLELLDRHGEGRLTWFRDLLYEQRQ